MKWFSWATLAALWGLFAVIAWLSPPQGDDWLHLAWAARADAPELLRDLAGSRVTGDLVGPALALWRPLHVLLSPTVIVALLVAMVVHARGRWPRFDCADDAFLVVAACALLSLAAPSFGAVVFHRQYLAVYLYPLAAMAWLLAAYRLGAPAWAARAPVPAALAAFLLGVVASASTRPIGTVGAAVAVALVQRRRRRGGPLPAWMGWGLAGLGLGVVLVWLDQPGASLGRLWFNRIDANLALLYEHVGQNGRIVGVLAVVLLALLVRQAWGGRSVPVPALEQLLALRWMVVTWAALALVGLVGPLVIVPVRLAPALVLCIAGLVVFDTLMSAAAKDAWLRRGLWLLVALPFVEILLAGMPEYLRARAQHQARLRQLATVPAGGIGTVRPSQPVSGSPWTTGESWARASLREDVARSLFGLDDIEFSDPFLELEPSLRWTYQTNGLRGLSDKLPYDFKLARLALRRASGTGDLLITNLDWPERAGRPVIAARLGVGKQGKPQARHTGPFADGHYSFWPDPFILNGDFEWWVLRNGGEAIRPARARGRFDFLPSAGGWHTLVACDARECWVMDPFHLRP